MKESASEARERAATFDDWLQAAATAPATARDEQLRNREQSPHGRYAHPREERLIPLMVVACAAGADRGVTTWSGAIAGLNISAFCFG